ncbi:hypothetical protein L6164_015964 [Bauhinia variegata]|uniref:Uncharacterized protein n=1 Tax=Bauhinia variegata TaxID=167791 RepID=A0ACB9NNI4_BAUVA|nr:hypothetical protein L6164_015964 [Bauhinia variegata]
MEIEETAGRISIGFPLGLALLFVLMLFMCAFFCCCLHWEKLQSFIRSSGSGNTHIQAVVAPPAPQKPLMPFVMMKQSQVESLPVLMPGDDMPKFIALACPCQPPKDETITIQVQKPDASEVCNGA